MKPKIAILKENVRKKIAAGEVIDRPFSVLRELLDNSIDAEATAIDCLIEGGGSTLIYVQDNGTGMSSADLELCWLSHATSKITTEQDLLHTSSLGFRGEALSSIAAVSHLEILSKDDDSSEGLKLIVEGGSDARFAKSPANRGTGIRVRNLFFNLPARKQFLKSAQGEASLCKNILIEKSIAHPGIGFKLESGAKTTVLLPALEKENYLERIAQAYPQCPQELLHTITGSGDHFSFKIVIGLPPLHRANRKFIHIYCNRRRITEFSLSHAVEYAFSSILPGGSYPVAFVFLTIDPAEIDCNIHPAKKEVRFRKPEAIHRRIRESIQHFIEYYDRHTSKTRHRNIPTDGFETPGFRFPSGEAPIPSGSTSERAAGKPFYYPGQEAQEAQEAQNSGQFLREGAMAKTHPPYRYLGQIFSVFLLVEIGEELYIIDMHAAHERILFERYRSNKESENLLIPMTIRINDMKDGLEEMCSSLNAMGFKSTVSSDGSLILSAVPTALRGKEKMIEMAIFDLGRKVSDLETALYENMACRTAVKDGDILDNNTACRIIEESWQLPVKRCPHGRPIWFILDKKELFQLLGRIV